ncbi:hypothetical protein [Halovivax cerinus]|uniref:Uncharacterized protein n=1 Tax=Halovivax cerinus TaxID=1487865 RepID=A0ABD5NRY6_9EURY|nr:hypothetical protein [Halovivax cerinus]
MTDEAARIYERSRRSERSAEEAWASLEALASDVDWDTAWLDDPGESAAERTERRRYPVYTPGTTRWTVQRTESGSGD